MYHSTGVQKLSESQKSKLRNGHAVRIKQGSGNTLHLTDAQIKKLAQVHKKGAAYTIQMHPEQTEKHGAGFFGDITTKAKSFARKHKDLIKFAQEDDKSNTDNPVDTVDSTPVEEVPQPVEPTQPQTDEQNSQQAEMAVSTQINTLVNQQANEFLKEISSLDSELTPEQIQELFKEKLLTLISQSGS